MIDLLPLRGEDPVEDGALPVLLPGGEDVHVLDDVKGKAVVWEGTQEVSFQEGGPPLLQHSLSTHVTLERKELKSRYNSL